jgi:hypothetical protein
MKAPSTCLLTLLAALLTGCAGAPVPPDWQTNAHGALKSFSSDYLIGNTQAAEREFARARNEIAGTGRGDLVARAELVRCAVRVASLEFDNCAGFQPMAQDASASELSYAAYLAGRWQNLDLALLPAQHRALLTAAPTGSDKSLLGSIDDPLARLVAAGALLQRGQLTPADITAVTETASAQGWRRPLLAWLGVQAKIAQEHGDRDATARIQRRIELVSKSSQ